MERHRESDADDKSWGTESTRPRGHSVAERATKKGVSKWRPGLRGGINREINGGEWGLRKERKTEHRYSHSERGQEEEALQLGREVGYLLSTVILTLVCRFVSCPDKQ